MILVRGNQSHENYTITIITNTSIYSDTLIINFQLLNLYVHDQELDVTNESAMDPMTPDMADLIASERPARALGIPSIQMPTTCDVVGMRKRLTSIEFSRLAHSPSPIYLPSAYNSNLWMMLY